MPITVNKIAIGKAAVESALKGIPYEKAVEIEQERIKKMAHAARAAAKPRRAPDPITETEDSDGINIFIKRKSSFLDDLTKE